MSERDHEKWLADDLMNTERDRLAEKMERALIAVAHFTHRDNESRAQLVRVTKERDEAVSALLNARGDDLCWITNVAQAKALPELEFMESCRRYRAQIAAERGEFTGGKTIAQLEAELAALKGGAQ